MITWQQLQFDLMKLYVSPNGEKWKPSALGTIENGRREKLQVESCVGNYSKYQGC